MLENHKLLDLCIHKSRFFYRYSQTLNTPRLNRRSASKQGISHVTWNELTKRTTGYSRVTVKLFTRGQEIP